MKYSILMTLLLSSQLFAQPSENIPTQPTAPSQPLPTLRETNNPDTVLSEKVQAAIHKNPILKNQALSAASVKGEVTLQGSVDTEEQKNEAIKTIKSVPGVTKVESQVTIKKLKQE